MRENQLALKEEREAMLHKFLELIGVVASIRGTT